MGRPSFSDVATLQDPLTIEAYTLTFSSIPGSTLDVRTAMLRCVQAVWEGSGIAKLTQPYPGGHILHYTGINQFQGSMQVMFIEANNMEISQALRAWKEVTRGTRSGNSAGYKSKYAVPAQLVIYDNSGVQAGVENFVNVFIENVQQVTVDPNSTQGFMIAATFSYDIVEDTAVTSL